MKFWDREKEKKWLKHYLLTEPNAILFVYGPKSSGKTALLMKVVEELPKETFAYYWYDLREKFIVGYENVVELFFKEKGWLRSFLSSIKPKINLKVFELESGAIEDIRKKKLDPFEEMRKHLEEDRARGQIPVIVFDELQKLKDVYLNGGNQRPLVGELFNFFVRLTKVLHLSHVIVMTSDTFFIEKVYFDSTLENTSRYYLVDYFDDETAIDILISEGLSHNDAKKIVEIAGGVPWILRESVKDEDPVKLLDELYKQTRSKMIELMGSDEKYSEILRDLLNGKDLYGVKDAAVRELVEKEVLFMDPVNGEIRFHTRLHERAAKELLGVE